MTRLRVPAPPGSPPSQRPRSPERDARLHQPRSGSPLSRRLQASGPARISPRIPTWVRPPPEFPIQPFPTPDPHLPGARKAQARPARRRRHPGVHPSSRPDTRGCGTSVPSGRKNKGATPPLRSPARSPSPFPVPLPPPSRSPSPSRSMSRAGSDGHAALERAGAETVKRAVQLDVAGRFQESLVCYQEGIDLLLQVVKGTGWAPPRGWGGPGDTPAGVDGARCPGGIGTGVSSRESRARHGSAGPARCLTGP